MMYIHIQGEPKMDHFQEFVGRVYDDTEMLSMSPDVCQKTF